MYGDTMALDAQPRRCMLCGTPIHLCMGFVLARDAIVAIRASLAGQPPPIKVRELCGRCIFIWDRIAENACV